jgi:hypothetical protein
MLQFEASLTDDTRSVNYDRNTFIIQATDVRHMLYNLVRVWSLSMYLYGSGWYSHNFLQSFLRYKRINKARLTYKYLFLYQ